MASHGIPQDEIAAVIQEIKSHPEYLDTAYLAGRYANCGLEVISDPFSRDQLAPIELALKEGRPFSAISIGDGEGNLLTYGRYANTGHLDRAAVSSLVSRQQDRFKIDETWMIVLRDLVMGAIAQADAVGVLGLWRAERSLTTDEIVQRFAGDFRGISGHWRAIDYTLKLARTRFMDGKLITSAHFYLSVVKYLDAIVHPARKIFVVTNRESVVEKMRKKCSGRSFEHISVGNVTNMQGTIPANPAFLSRVCSAFPSDMRGCLCLVGSGFWSLIYCTWIRQLGGVAVDIGSGVDLLDGEFTRPVHGKIGLEMLKKYAL